MVKSTAVIHYNKPTELTINSFGITVHILSNQTTTYMYSVYSWPHA